MREVAVVRDGSERKARRAWVVVSGRRVIVVRVLSVSF